MSETLIKVENLSKKFCRSLKQSLWYGLQDLGKEIVGKRHSCYGNLRRDEFWAVKDVSFELKRGECLGLIGRNGAGKTTLLRMLNGLIKPDQGRIEIRGRVGALIALGAGFNPILTGRENIHVNASVLGLSTREIDEKMDKIIDFSELGESIDMPVQSYSSGMKVRLGFAVASIVEPDVLLLDEVLAVGDAAFKFKCYRRMDELLSRSAVIFVSHDMPQVARVCDKTLLLNGGQVFFNGSTLQGIEAYQAVNEGDAVTLEKVVRMYYPITSFNIFDLQDEVSYQMPFLFKAEVKSEKNIGPATLRIDVKNQGGAFAAACVVSSEAYGISIEAGKNVWEIEVSSLPLKPGNYTVGMNISDLRGALIAVWSGGHKVAVKGGHLGIVPDCQLSLNLWRRL